MEPAMSFAEKPATELPRDPAETQQQGPVEIDPSLFGLVSGGSPKNGWSTSTVLAASELDSPKNGWL
jgi:hypothetical protein